MRLDADTAASRCERLEGEKVANENFLRARGASNERGNFSGSTSTIALQKFIRALDGGRKVSVRVASDGFKDCSFASRAWDSHFGRRRTSKVLYVTASAALPRKGPFSSRGFDLSERRFSLIANRRQRDYQRVERRFHKFNSSC